MKDVNDRALLQWLMMLEADVEVRRRWMKMRVETWACSVFNRSLCWMTSALRNLRGGGAGRRQFKPKKLIAVYEGKYGCSGHEVRRANGWCMMQ